MLFVELHPFDPRLYLAFEYVVRLALVTVYDAMAYFVNEHSGFYLLRAVLRREVHLPALRIAQAVVLAQIGVNEELYSILLTILGYELVYLALPH